MEAMSVVWYEVTGAFSSGILHPSKASSVTNNWTFTAVWRSYEQQHLYTLITKAMGSYTTVWIPKDTGISRILRSTQL
jgi:hypothetical protein